MDEDYVPEGRRRVRGNGGKRLVVVPVPEKLSSKRRSEIARKAAAARWAKAKRGLIPRGAGR